MSDEPQILIKPSAVACPGHGEHLRAQWPSGFLMYSMTIINQMFKNEELIRECGGNADNKADVNKINEVLAVRPACYFVDRDTIRQALMESAIGAIGICQICSRSSIGGPYTLNDMGIHKELPHVCFECALDTGERIHQAHPKGGVWNE